MSTLQNQIAQSLEGLNDNALRQYFKRMLKSGDLARFDTGIYYLPKTSQLLKKVI